MIKIYCRTNLDGYETETWPTVCPIEPSIGYAIQGRSGRRLWIVSITIREVKDNWSPLPVKWEPEIELELHNFSSIPK